MSPRILDFALGAVTAVSLMGWFVAAQGDDVVAAAQVDGAGPEDFLMATGTAAHGGALLFVLNTKTRTLNVYEAEGGSRATRGVTFVASRKIERDLYVTGYNDKSEYSYQDLVERIRAEEARVRGTDQAPVDGGPGDGN